MAHLRRLLGRLRVKKTRRMMRLQVPRPEVPLLARLEVALEVAPRGARLEVFRLATISSIEDRSVRLLTVLPPKAAPNLALGTVLTWDESTRTDFSAAAAQVAATTAQLPETVLERLQLPVDAEFSRVPLFEALDYIGGEIQVAVEIDGDALKDAGFTKNMAQTFTLGKVPAAQALAHIIGQYKEPGKEMVVVIDEPRKTLLVLTRKFAEQQGLTVHEFGG